MGFSGNRNFQITCFNNLRKFLSKVISIERLRTTRLNIYKFFSKEISKERLRTSRFNNIHKFFLVQFQRKSYVHHALIIYSKFFVKKISKERLRTSHFNNLHKFFSKEISKERLRT